MKVIQSYQQGARHIVKDQPCEDRTFYLSKNGVEVIALADGAGSQKYTHAAMGAACVTETICKFFCNNFDKFSEKQDFDEMKSIIVAVCQKKLAEKAAELELDSIVRLSSTLLCVAIKEDKVVVCHIGDGVIGRLTPRGTQVVSAPENGEFESTTYFITNPNACQHIHIIKEDMGDTISYFLMSDGTSEYVYNKFENEFYDAAKKMALMSLEKDGQVKLENTISSYMIDNDSKSDDCSFICLTIDITEILGTTSTNTISREKNGNDEKLTVDVADITNQQKLPIIIDNFDHEKEMNETKHKSSKTVTNRKKTTITIIALVIFAIIIALSSFMISKHSKNKPSEMQGETTTISLFKTNITKEII